MMSKPVALISGGLGMDGALLADFLLQKNYEVHIMVRRVSVDDENRYSKINHIKDKIYIHGATLENYPSIYKVVQKVKPNECYHLAAQSFVSYSFEDEFSTMQTNINGTHYMLAAIKEIVPECKFYFAGTSEMFGNSIQCPQNEDTPFAPRSTYGISKVTGHNLVINYKDAYNLFACTGFLFNHEHTTRPTHFVTRKITNTVAKIKLGLEKELKLGNLDAKRDWGWAPDYIRGMWKILQQEKPDNYVLATGDTHSVREFCDVAFRYVDLDYKDYVVVNPKFYRPADVFTLCGDPTKAREKLGWKSIINFEELVTIMVEADLKKENCK